MYEFRKSKFKLRSGGVAVPEVWVKLMGSVRKRWKSCIPTSAETSIPRLDDLEIPTT
jgi:hypothetical protein